jgi:hypothetical protein
VTAPTRRPAASSIRHAGIRGPDGGIEPLVRREGRAGCRPSCRHRSMRSRSCRQHPGLRTPPRLAPRIVGGIAESIERCVDGRLIAHDPALATSARPTWNCGLNRATTSAPGAARRSAGPPSPAR